MEKQRVEARQLQNRSTQQASKATLQRLRSSSSRMREEARLMFALHLARQQRLKPLWLMQLRLPTTVAR